MFIDLLLKLFFHRSHKDLAEKCYNNEINKHTCIKIINVINSIKSKR